MAVNLSAARDPVDKHVILTEDTITTIEVLLGLISSTQFLQRLFNQLSVGIILL
jgi:hypothetical protein